MITMIRELACPAPETGGVAEDGAAGDEFGLTVAISGTIAIVGTRQDDDNGTKPRSFRKAIMEPSRS